MSFLDRLKREADQQRLQAEQQALEREQREARYKTQIEPKMKALTSYLEGLAATLQEVKPPIVVRMAIQGYGDLCTVPFWDYKVEHERRHRSFAISMAWSQRVDAERTPVVRADSVTRVKALTGVFRQYHLGGIKEEKRTPQGEISCATFHARGYIKARMEASISADDPVLRLVFENASWLGASRRQVPWELIDDNLFDRIGRFIVREDDSLFTEELSDALKQKLRKDQEPGVVASAPSAAPSVMREPAPATTTGAPTPQAAAPQPPQPEPTEIYAPGMVAPPPLLTQGEVIEIDESKLGLADFAEDDDTFNVFSPAAPGRTPPAAKPQPAPTASIGVIPAPPPMSGGEVIPIDESKLGLSAEPASIVIERTPTIAPTPAAPKAPAPAAPAAPATAAAPAAPAARPQAAAPAPSATPQHHAAARPPAAAAPSAPAPGPAAVSPAAPAVATATASAAAAPAVVAPATVSAAAAPAVAPATVSAAAAPAVAPTTASAAAAPAAAAKTSTTVSPAGADADAPAAAAGEGVDEAKEREAALFRLRMRAMMARLRSDEPEQG